MDKAQAVMDTVFSEGQSGLKVVLFVIVLLGLLALAFWLLRRFGAGRLVSGATRGRQPRLAGIDQATVDSRRRLVLIRRDNGGASAHHRRSERRGGGAEHRARGNRAAGNRSRTSARYATGPPRRREHVAAAARTGASACSSAAQGAHGRPVGWTSR